MLRCFSELKKFKTFKERYDYLQLEGSVGESTFGFDRYLNQIFYHSYEWMKTRDDVILRDAGCDLGVAGFEIRDKIYIHHMNAITVDEIRNRNPVILDPEYLICVSSSTHLALHYGDQSLLRRDPIVRSPGDTRLW